MPRARANRIEIEYDTFGDKVCHPILLMDGLGHGISYPDLWDDMIEAISGFGGDPA